MHTYKQMIAMVTRLIRAGMDEYKAINEVSSAYCVDANALREYFHHIGEGK